MPDTQSDLYCIDTSAVIHGWTRDYPPDVFATVWQNLEPLADQEKLFAPNEVLLELERGGDDLYEWARSRNAMFIEPDAYAQEIVRDLVNDYPGFIPADSRDGIWADPYVIAIASQMQAVVVTGEKPVGHNARIPKIPNICNDLGVEYMDLLGLIRTEGWSF